MTTRIYKSQTTQDYNYDVSCELHDFIGYKLFIVYKIKRS